MTARAQLISLCSIASLVTSSACAGESTELPVQVPYAFTVVPWVTDANNNWFLLDTGSPRTMVRPEVVGMPASTFADTKAPGWEVPGFETDVIDVLLTESLPTALLAAEANDEIRGLGGILGADLLAQTPFAIEPVTATLHIGALPDGYFGEPTALDVERLGGGSTCASSTQCWEYGPSRLIVPIDIGGVETYGLVDTAATYVTITSGLMERVRAVGGNVVEFNNDAELGSVGVARIPEIAIGSALRNEVPVVVRNGQSTDAAFARLHVETGRRVEVLIGHSFWMNYVMAVDFAKPSIRLYERSSDEPLPIDNFISTGVSLQVTEQCWSVSGLVRESRAADQGLRVGDCIVAIDGIRRESLTLDQAETTWTPMKADEMRHIDVNRQSEQFELWLELEQLLPPNQ